MTDETTVTSNPMDMQVTNNSATGEQESPKMMTTEPSTPELQDAPVVEITEEPVKPEPTVEPVVDNKANDSARKAMEAQMRAENAERQLRELQPKNEAPDKEPDISDQKTWGKKYQNSPNDLENFLKAHADWAMESGRQQERQSATQARQQQEALKIRTAVATKEAESRTKHADYDQIIATVAPFVGSSPLLMDFVAKHPMGTEVIYELAKNPAIFQQVMQSDTWTAGDQLISMANRLKKPVVAPLTSAPEPIKPIGSRETVKPRLVNLASNDINGYMKLRNKQELADKRIN